MLHCSPKVQVAGHLSLPDAQRHDAHGVRGQDIILAIPRNIYLAHQLLLP